MHAEMFSVKSSKLFYVNTVIKHKTIYSVFKVLIELYLVSRVFTILRKYKK